MIAEGVEEGRTQFPQVPLDGLDAGEGGQVDDVAGEHSGIDTETTPMLQRLPEDLACWHSPGRALLERLPQLYHTLGGIRVALVPLGHVAVGEVQNRQVALQPLDVDGRHVVAVGRNVLNLHGRSP